MNKLLIELKERLNQISITGLKSVSEDFRLRKLYEKLNAVNAKAPVLAKISALILQLLNENSNRYIIFSELINLTNAILYTQDTTSANEEETAVELLEHTDVIPHIPYSQIKSIKKVLDGGTNVLWSELKKAYDDKNLIDYRLLDNFIKRIGDTYVYEAKKSIAYIASDSFENKINDTYEYSIVTILSAYGDSIVPILMKKYYKSTNQEKVNIIKIISNIGGGKYDSFYKKCIDEEINNHIVYSLIKALAYNSENEDFLLNLKATNKTLKKARLYSLIYISGIKSYEEIKICCIKDTDVFESLFEYHEIDSKIENVLADLIKDCVQKIQQQNLENSGDVKASIAFEKFGLFIKATQKFHSETIVNALIEAFESEIELKLDTRIVALSILKQGDKKSLNYLADLKDKYNGCYLAISFISALKAYSKIMVFNNFSPLVFKTFEPPQITVNEVMQKLLNYHRELARIDTDTTSKCLACSSFESCYPKSKIRKSGYKEKIVFKSDEFIDLNDLVKLEWDSKWFEYGSQLIDKDPEAHFDFLYFLIDYSYKYNRRSRDEFLKKFIESEVEINHNKRKAVKKLFLSDYEYDLQYIVKLKDKYNGYYSTLSFIAALGIYNKGMYTKEEVFDIFSPIALNTGYKNTVTIVNVINQICRCRDYNFESVGIDFSKDEDDYIKISKIFGTLNFELDSRWLDYALSNSLIELSSNLLTNNMEESQKQKIEIYYLEQLQNLKTLNGDKRFYAGFKVRSPTEEEEKVKVIIVSAIKGLLKLGNRTEVFENIIYFASAIDEHGPIPSFIKAEDEVFLQKLEAEMDLIPKVNQSRIKRFIERSRTEIQIRKNTKGE